MGPGTFPSAGLLSPAASSGAPGGSINWRGLYDAAAADLADARDAFIRAFQTAAGMRDNYTLGEGDTDAGARGEVRGPSAMSLAGLGMTGAAPGGLLAAPRGGAVLGAGPIRAYHGSPHNFDRFDISKIGTGEGAQAYGHGLYFAENEGVARSYRDALAKGHTVFYDNVPSYKLPDATRRAALAVERELADGLNPQDAKWLAAKKQPDLQSAIASIDAAKLSRDTGRMYEVAIHADPERFLDWDKPLSQQALKSEAVDQVLLRAPAAPAGRGAAPRPYTLEELREYGATGRELYDRLSWAAGKPGAFPEINVAQPRGASEALRDAGIPGIRYLDAGSRSAGDGSRNYVVFDDKLIEILRKYGMLPAAIGGGAAAAAQPVGLLEQ